MSKFFNSPVRACLACLALVGCLLPGFISGADPTPEDAIWKELLQTDEAGTKQAYRHMRALIEKPDQAIAFLKARLKPVDTPAIPERIAKLIAELHSDQFKVRQNAFQQLEKLGVEAQPALQKELGTKPSLEVSSRLEQLLAKITGPAVPPEVLRAMRGVEVLEQLGTEQARALLKDLAGGTAGFPITTEAQKALERLARR
jgi:hypothetical protein